MAGAETLKADAIKVPTRLTMLLAVVVFEGLLQDPSAWPAIVKRAICRCICIPSYTSSYDDARRIRRSRS